MNFTGTSNFINNSAGLVSGGAIYAEGNTISRFNIYELCTFTTIAFMSIKDTGSDTYPYIYIYMNIYT